MGIEPTFPGYVPGVLSQLNYGNTHEPAVTCTIRRRGLFADDDSRRSADSDGQVVPQIRGFASGTRTRITGLASSGSLMVSNHPFGLER